MLAITRIKLQPLEPSDLAIIGTLFLFQQLRLEHNRTTLAIIALSNMSSGKEEYALKIIDEMKSSSPTDILVSELSSDIAAKKRSALSSSMQVSADTAPKTTFTAPAERPAVRARARANAPYRRPAKQPKNPIIYGADSVSYF